jgi:hypothetical protein
MATLDELQKLDDAPFHQLCDDLLRRLEVRYRRLRTHGINPQGVSIKGQPDSYVGETANTCTIAFCYTVQRAGWWNKVVEDVKEAVAASLGVREIVAAIPHNTDRDGPKDKTIDWLGDAKAAAGQATLRVVDGREIAGYLDRDHQDLRYEHLRTPYSRLSGQSILVSCRSANEQAVTELAASGRYDPTRYAPREADRELFALWQRALRPDPTAGSSGRRGPTRLIALVNDAGVGKTSLLTTFARSIGSALPALLLQARNLSFASEDGLVSHVVHALQGVLESKARPDEEAAITHHLAAGTPLTVVLDGLDEAKDAASVRKAITHWLRSRLGQASILIVSCRPEFWKVCVDRGWTHWMQREAPDERTPATTLRRSSFERTDPADGIRLPDRFSEGDLEAAWLRAGRSRDSLFGLPGEAREELRHPFTLRVYLDLSSSGSAVSGRTRRAELLEAWLNRWLDQEAVPGERLTRQQYQQALGVIATLLAGSGAGSLAVDDLAGVPRFDRTRPPGPVVERLVAASVLESVPGQPDRIRFAVETVQDFYRAEAEVTAIVAAPAHAAEEHAKLRFTEAYLRLTRIGQLLAKVEARHEFVGHLADADPLKAAVVLRADPTRYEPELQRKVTAELGRQIGSRHRVRGAFAISLLSDLPCEEARQCLAAHLLPPADPHPYLKDAGATAFIKINWVGGVALVYQWRWFRQEPGRLAYYFKDILALMRGAKADFSAALADHAWRQIDCDSGTKDHGRAVCVLAYLGDARLVPHLGERLVRNGFLQDYENHALFALGTDPAGEVFYRSAKATLAQIAQLGYKVGTSEWASLFTRVSPASGDRQYLITAQVEPHIRRLITDDDREAFSLGFDLAIRSRCPGLIYHAVVAWSRHYFGGPADWVRGWVSPDTWLGWWNALTDVASRQKLLQLIPTAANVRIEEVLLDCLDHADLRGQSAWHLGHFGCVRAAARLRQMLADGPSGLKLWEKENFALALGLHRDAPSIEALRVLGLAEPKTEAGMFAVMALGLIGTAEAEIALNSLLGTEVDEGHVGAALICCGTSSAVAIVVAWARSRPDGPKWLCECMSRAFWPNNRRYRTEYYTHVATTELVAYLSETEKAVEIMRDVLHAFEAIDSEEVRQLLRRLAGRGGSAADPVVRDDGQLKMSRLCYSELMRRGDVSAVPYFVDERANEEDRVYVHLAADSRSHFPSEAVAAELRSRIVAARDDTRIASLLSLLGRFGNNGDEGLIRPFLDHPDDLVANVACESLLRLTDPMLVPENWREL